MSSKRPPGGPPHLKDSHKIGDVAPNQPHKDADGQKKYVPMAQATTEPPQAKKTFVEQVGKSPQVQKSKEPKKDKDHDKD